VDSRLEEYGIQVTPDELERIVEAIKSAGDDRKLLHDADIIEIAERVTGRNIDVIPKDIDAMVNIAVESHVYTGAVVRKLKNFKHVYSVFEMTGEYDISSYVKVPGTADLNNLIEELRAIPGVKQTNTRIVLKKHQENHLS
jgi:2-isopropylmalate synthase